MQFPIHNDVNRLLVVLVDFALNSPTISKIIVISIPVVVLLLQTFHTQKKRAERNAVLNIIITTTTTNIIVNTTTTHTITLQVQSLSISTTTFSQLLQIGSKLFKILLQLLSILL